MMTIMMEKIFCILIGFTIYATIKVMDYYVDKDRKEAEAQK